MTTNVVRAFLNETGRYFETEPVFAYNYGNLLEIAGVELPVYFEVHFAKKETGNSVTVLGENNLVPIPDELLLEGNQVLAWIYLHTGATDGETVYVIRIPVLRRARITGAEPTPVEQGIIEQAIAALENGVETVQDVAERIPGTINDALQQAKDSGEFDGPPGKDGAPGQDGAPGADGFSPTATVTKSGKTATITITDKNGTTTATVKDGEDSADIIDDTAGAGDTDKAWSADKLTAEFGNKVDKADIATEEETQQIIDEWGDEGMLVETEFVELDVSNVVYRTLIDAEDIADAFMHGKNVVVHFPKTDRSEVFGIGSDMYLNLNSYVPGAVTPGQPGRTYIESFGFSDDMLRGLPAGSGMLIEPTSVIGESYVEEDMKLYFRVVVD